jgi:hypothetical protein
VSRPGGHRCKPHTDRRAGTTQRAIEAHSVRSHTGGPVRSSQPIGREQRLENDDALMRQLGLRVPDAVVARAKAAFLLSTPPGTLLPLTGAVFDDVDDRRRPVHRLAFRRDELSVRVRVLVGPGAAHVAVTVDPPQFGSMELQVQDAEGGVGHVAFEQGPSPEATSPDGDRAPVQFLLPVGIVRLHIEGSPIFADLYSEWFHL